MRVYIVIDDSDVTPEVVDVFDSLEKADDRVMEYYYTHSQWLKLFEHDIH